MPRRLLALTVLLLAAFALLPAPPAAACSCAGPPSVESSIAAVDVAFVGTVLERDDALAFRIRVEEVAKDTVGLPEVALVQGADAAGGCGPDYGGGGEVAVFAMLDEGRLVGRGCLPHTADDLKGVDPQPPPTGRGPVAALASLPYRWANIAALDGAGKVLASNYLPVSGQLAVCPGGRRALVAGFDRAFQPVRATLDIASLQLVGEIVPAADVPFDAELACILDAAGEPLLVVARASIDDPAGAALRIGDVEVDVAPAAAIAVVGDRMVLAGPADEGAPLRAYSLPGGEEVAELDVEDLVAIDVAVDRSGERAAVLLSDGTVDDGGYGLEPTAVRLLDLTGEVPVAAGGFELAPADGWGRAVAWAGDLVAVERELFDGRRLDLHAPDGARVSSTAVGQTLPLVDLGDRALLTTRTGLASLDGAGTLVETVSVTDDGFGFYGTSLAAVVDGPEVEAVSPPEYLLRPRGEVDPVPTTVVAAPPATTPGPEPGAEPAGAGSPPWALLAVLAAVAVGGAAFLTERALRKRDAHQP